MAPVLLLLGGAFSLFLLVATFVLLAMRLRGGSFKGGLKRAAEFVVWAFLVCQLLAQVGRSAAPGLPPILRGLYDGLALFLFDFRVVSPPQCMSGYLFLGQVVQMSAGIALAVLSGIMLSKKGRLEVCCRCCVTRAEALEPTSTAKQKPGSWLGPPAAHDKSEDREAAVTAPLANRRDGAGRKCGLRRQLVEETITPLVRRGAFTAASLLYPLVTNTAFMLVVCERENEEDAAGNSVEQFRLASNSLGACTVYVTTVHLFLP